MYRPNAAPRTENGDLLPFVMWSLTLVIFGLWANGTAHQTTLFALNVPVALIAWKLSKSKARVDRAHAGGKLVLDATVLVLVVLFSAGYAQRQRQRVFIVPPAVYDGGDGSLTFTYTPDRIPPPTIAVPAEPPVAEPPVAPAPLPSPALLPVDPFTRLENRSPSPTGVPAAGVPRTDVSRREPATPVSSAIEAGVPY